MKKTLLLTLLSVLTLNISAQKYVGGDISMLTKYEEAGVVYRDKSGATVQPLTFFHDQGLNAMRVRLFVDPSKDSDKGVCQDLEYVKSLGKRIKDAGFKFMLDFHYSDTWADPSNQWTPDAWKTMTDEELKTQIYQYTESCLQQLKAVGATPDFIQTGNEISFGMLWGTKAAHGNDDVNRCYINSSTSYWSRFFDFLKEAGKACRKECPDAKIIIHSEQVPSANVLFDYFDRLKSNSIDYDIIGLSYYPDHHKDLNTLESVIKQFETKNYGKDIMIVETGYGYKWGIGTAYDYTSVYPRTEEGQRRFTADLITMLKKHSLVTGLFWWWPEDNGNKGVTNNYWNAALYNHDTGMPYAAFYELKKFVTDEENTKDVTSQYIVNPSFTNDISGWTNTGGTAQWMQKTWAPLSNYCEFAWTGNAIVDQKVVQTPTLPAGSYELTVNCASNANSTGVFLIAGDQSVENVETSSVSITVAAETAVEIGIKLQNTTATWVNFDNFVLMFQTTSGIETITTHTQTNNNAWYTLDGRRLIAEPTQKGLYIHNGKKIIVK